MAIGALVAAWLAVRPHETHVADAMAWLQGDPAAVDNLLAALREVLIKLWRDAWKAGAKAAAELTGAVKNIPAQVAADRIARMAHKWLHEVLQTRLRGIAELLAGGGTAAQLEAAIRALLNSLSDARRVVITEVHRAMMAAASEAYRDARVPKVRWVTRSANPCPICLANEASGPHHLGEPFPSGSTSPPEHPNCECALMPADEE